MELTSNRPLEGEEAEEGEDNDDDDEAGWSLPKGWSVSPGREIRGKRRVTVAVWCLVSLGAGLLTLSLPLPLFFLLFCRPRNEEEREQKRRFFFSDHFRERRGRDRNCLLAQFNSRPTTDWVGKSSSLSLSFLDRETFFSFLPPFLLLFTYLRVKQFSLRVVSGGKKKKERNREDGSRHNRRGRESRERRGKSAIY